MLFVPWRNEQKDLLGSFDTYEAHYNSVQTSLIPKRNEYEHHIEELELARQMMKDEQREYDQTAPNAEQENREAEEEGSKDSSSLSISIRAELLSIGTMILELNYSQLVQCHL